MTVPTYDKFIEPLLGFLARHPTGVATREAHEDVAAAMNLTEEQRSELLPSGRQAIYKNRIGWAHDRLKRAGLSASPRRGVWQLTDAGRKYASAHSEGFTEEQLSELALANVDVRLRPTDDDAVQSVSPAASTIAIASTSPDERLEEALTELTESVAQELLESIAQSSPKFFETLVLDLLHAMGYGTSRSDLQRVGGPGDGGIDGIISLDRLGLEKVYVQAKRWQNNVSRPEIQGFYGALAGQRAKKGVFITTSAYTAQAVDFANSVEGIVLVDGQRLAELMIDHGIGVSHRVLKVPTVDSDYFEE